MNDKEKIDKALEVILDYWGIDGDHHKQWVIDQVVRLLTGENYDDWVSEYEKYDDDWDSGIAP